jgi:hypothetical protein
MSGALNSVFGGGNVLGAALNIAGLCFPPLGIATSLANIATQAVGQAVNFAAQTLSQECGMPKFLTDTVKQVVDDVVGGQTRPSDEGCDQRCQSDQGVQDWQKSFIDDLCKSLVDTAKEEMSSDRKGAGRKGGSWLEALARALGEAAGEKAGKMVELTDKISGLAGDSSPEAAKEMTAVQGELSGVSKMFALMQETMNTTIKSIGEGLSTVARKQ